MTIKEFDTVHQIFPTEIMEFKDIEIPQCVLDALHDEELGLTNFPYGVYTSKGNLHHRPEFALVNKQIQDCLDRWTISYKLMCDRLKLSLMWAVYSKAHSNASHPTHRHPYAVVSGILYLTDGVSTIFHDPVVSRERDCLEITREDGWLPYWSNPAKKGTLLLWPGWLMHSSAQNDAPTDRWALSFNAMPDGHVNMTSFNYPMANISIS